MRPANLKTKIFLEGNLETIPYQELDLAKDWQDFDIFHKLTKAGIEKFAYDWNHLTNS